MKYTKLVILLCFLFLCYWLPGCSFKDDIAVTSDIMTSQINEHEMFNVSDITKVTPISVTINHDEIVLYEDNLEVTLHVGDLFIYQHNLIVDSLPNPPVKVDTNIYLSTALLKDYLTSTNVDNLSLYHGAKYRPGEVLAAINDPEDQYNKKILAAVELPRSFNISIPKIDESRIINRTPLQNMPAVLMEELQRQGYDAAQNYTYGEYLVISGTQSLQAAGLTSLERTYPELRQIDISHWTVKDYRRWQELYTQAQHLAMLSEEEQKLMAARNILYEDMFYLRKEFHNSVLEQSDEVLKACLEDYYQFTIDRLFDMEGSE